MSLRAGEFDRLITFRQNTPTQNNKGEMEPNWSTLSTVWARVRMTREEEVHQFEQNVAFEQMDFTVRYQERFRNYKLSISYDGKLFDILGIKEVGRKEALIIKARAKI